MIESILFVLLLGSILFCCFALFILVSVEYKQYKIDKQVQAILSDMGRYRSRSRNITIPLNNDDNILYYSSKGRTNEENTKKA